MPAPRRSRAKKLDTSVLTKALSHPLRVEILKKIVEKGTASPNELANDLDAPLGNVSYHVRHLAGIGIIKLAKKTPRRGAIEHHYKAEPVAKKVLEVQKVVES